MASDWVETTLGTLGQFRNGINFNRLQEGIGLPVLKVKDIGDRFFAPDQGYDELNPEMISVPDSQLLRSGDVVIIRSNGNRELVGRSVYFSGTTTATTFSGFCIRFRPEPSILHPRFAAYLIRSPSFRSRFTAYGAGTGIQNLSQEILGSMPVKLPPLHEQCTIAHILGSFDDKIDLNRRMNETLEAMALAIFKDWFVDFGPVRAKMEDRAPYLVSDLWALFPDRLDDEGRPEGWKTEAVLAQANWINGAAYKNMHSVEPALGLPVVKIAELKNGVTSQTRFTNTGLGDRYQIRDGEILFSWSGNPDTSIDTFIWTGGPAWLNQHIFAVRDNGRRTPAYVYVMLKWLKPLFAELARNKQTTGLGHVTKEDLGRLQIVAPSSPIALEFDRLVTPIFDRLCAALFETRTLTSLRGVLLPKLMSGEIRVKDAETVIEAAL
jgi:type I restriction enzyme S subunit